jgi:hypothetical protein
MVKRKLIKSPKFDFSKLYNNTKYSDIKIELKNGDIMNSHKIVLLNSSDYFDLDKDILKFEENDEIVKKFLSFLYGEHFEYSTEDELYDFILLSKKVIFKQH